MEQPVFSLASYYGERKEAYLQQLDRLRKQWLVTPRCMLSSKMFPVFIALLQDHVQITFIRM